MNSRTVWRNPRTRFDSEKSIAVSCPLRRRERLEVSTENAIEIRRAEPRLLDLAEDGAVIVAAVAGRVPIGSVAPVQAARRAQHPERAMSQRSVEVRAGEIHEDVLAPERVVPERAVPGNSRVRVDELQAGEALRQAPEVAALRARTEVHQHRLLALLAE